MGSYVLLLHQVNCLSKMILALVFVLLSTNLSMVHTGFVNIPATYVNENVTKYNVRRIDLAIDPHPIKLKPKEEVKIHFGMDLMKRVPENDDLKVNISVTKEGYKIGSVEYDGNRLFELVETFFENSDDCTHYFPGNGCKLPLIPGHYLAPYGKNGIYFPFSVPELKNPLSPFLKKLIKGSYEIQICLKAVYEDAYKEIGWKWVIEIDF